jgi:hypothetical protein
VKWLSPAAPDFNIQQLPWTTPRGEGRVETRWGSCCCISLLDLPVPSRPLPSSAVHMLVSWFPCCLINEMQREYSLGLYRQRLHYVWYLVFPVRGFATAVTCGVLTLTSSVSRVRWDIRCMVLHPWFRCG